MKNAITARIKTANGDYDTTFDSKYDFRTAISNLNAAADNQVVMIGDYLAVRAGDFINGAIIDEGEGDK